MTWNVLLIATILLMSISGFGMAYAYSGQVFFMKSNSTAKIYVEVTFSSLVNTILSPRVFLFPPPDSLEETDSVIVTELDPVISNHQSSLNITYVITAKNIKGTFKIHTGQICGGRTFYPLVVGLNESEIDPAIFHTFEERGASFGCSNSQVGIREIIPIGFSGITPITLFENSTWDIPKKSSTPEFPLLVSILIALSIVLIIILYKFKIINRR